MNGLMTVTIEDGALLECKFPGGVMLPEGVTKIGAFAFCDCKGLTSVTFLGMARKLGNAPLRAAGA